MRLRRPRFRRGQAPGWLYIAVLLVIVSAVAGVPYFVAGEDARRPPIDPRLTTLPLPAGIGLEALQAARVEDVIDGDTIEVTVEGRRVRVRYYGVDAPERGERCFREALDRNETLTGKTVLLLPDARDQDRFDRYLRYIFRADGTSIDATLVAEGFATAWREDGQYRDELLALENEARVAGRGCLWQ